MVDFRAFRGLRPTSNRVELVAAVPYDVCDTAEARVLAAGNPLSLLHVTRPEIDLPDDASPHSEAAYAQARRAFETLRGQGVVLLDAEPGFYAYAQQMGEHRQLGIVGLASAADYDAGRIKKHELTRPEKEDDRLRHLETVGAHLGPVFLTYRARAAIDERLARLTATGPEVDFVAHDGVRHRVWPVHDAEDVAALTAAFADVPALYIADGHHRAAAAARLARAMAGEGAGHFLAVAFPDTQLRILAYNRVVRDLSGRTPAELLAALEAVARIEPFPAAAPPEGRHEITMCLGGAWYRLHMAVGAAEEADPVRRLDVSVLQDRVLAPLLGIADPRRDTRIDFVGGIRGLAELERRAGASGGVAFALYPTSLAELMDIADAGTTMPPKSTWFEPKLRSGLVMNLFRP